MDAIIDVLYDDAFDHDEAVTAIRQLYYHVPERTVSAMVYDTRRALSKGDVVTAERKVHKFIVGPGRPPTPEPAPRAPWWRRLWWSDYAMGWVFGAFCTVALLTAVEVAR